MSEPRGGVGSNQYQTRGTAARSGPLTTTRELATAVANVDWSAAVEDRWVVRTTKAGRRLFAPADIGLTVRPADDPDCPFPAGFRPDGNPPTLVAASAIAGWFTTQSALDADLVAEKAAHIARSDTSKIPGVEVVAWRGRAWMFDGHHALAAYHLAGKPVPVWTVLRGGPDRSTAPYLGNRPRY